MQDIYEILVVDDVSENIKVAISILQNDSYNFSYALDGKEAIEILKTKRFDLILLDVMMPNLDGFGLCKIIKNSPSIKDTPIIFVTAKVDIESIEEGFRLGGVDYVTKPYHAVELRARVANHLELYRYRKELAKSNSKLTKEIKEVKTEHLSDLETAQKEIIYILSEIMESDSLEIASHVKRVASISKQLALLEGNLTLDEMKIIYLASPLHDIGNVLIDKNLLNKKEKLTPTEFEAVKKHTQNAMKILKNSKQELIVAAKTIASQHHENFDGSGYPKGLKSEQIHIYARIVAIADVLDALTHDSSYKEAWSFEDAAKFIMDESGKKFDPRLVELFAENLESFKEIIEGDVCP